MPLKVFFLSFLYFCFAFSGGVTPVDVVDLEGRFVEILSLVGPEDFRFKHVNLKHQRDEFLGIGDLALVDDLIFEFIKNGNSYVGLCGAWFKVSVTTGTNKMYVKCRFEDSDGNRRDLFEPGTYSWQANILIGRQPIL